MCSFGLAIDNIGYIYYNLEAVKHRSGVSLSQDYSSTSSFTEWLVRKVIRGAAMLWSGR